MVEPHLRATRPAAGRHRARGGTRLRGTLSAAGVALALIALVAADAARAAEHAGEVAADRASAAPACDPDDAGLTVAEGWCARLFAEDLGAVRNLDVAPDGTLYAARKDEGAPAGLALRDTNGDGRAERREAFGPAGPAHGVLVRDGAVWLALDRRVLRFARGGGALAPSGEGEAVVEDLPEQSSHARKAIALGGGALYVNVGAPSNACQEQARTPRSPGQDPCPQLERHGGIWRFDAAKTGQRQEDGVRFATGVRHVLALAVHPRTGRLWGAMNGRDQLASLWGFSAERNAQLPAEEMFAIDEGDDFGWPYCYHDGVAGRKVLAPEYGGDGETVGRCAEAEAPDLAFPAHWAPMDLAFATSDAAEDADGGSEAVAYVAFRGSWNRAPLPQEGYRVARVPFRGGVPAGDFSTFAIGAESDTQLRFTGVAVGPDGAVYVAAENEGRVWRIVRRR